MCHFMIFKLHKIKAMNKHCKYARCCHYFMYTVDFLFVISFYTAYLVEGPLILDDPNADIVIYYGTTCINKIFSYVFMFFLF